MSLDLLDILSYTRQAGTVGEIQFVNALVFELEALGFKPEADGYGNIIVDNGGETLFTSHTDTCHRQVGSTHQELCVDDEFGMVSLACPNEGSVLGADDGTGIYIMLQMLTANVKGMFIFFRDEEIGGLGSEFFVKTSMAGYGSRFKRAVAFDRKGDSEIITHQYGGRCCSDAFALALGKSLKSIDNTLDLRPSNLGSFTDTANFVDWIPECTNIAVGYMNQHTCDEIQDLEYLDRLIPALIKVDWERLPVERQVGQYEDDYDYGYYDSWSSYRNPTWVASDLEDYIDEIVTGGEDAALGLVIGNPNKAAELLDYLING